MLKWQRNLKLNIEVFTFTKAHPLDDRILLHSRFEQFRSKLYIIMVKESWSLEIHLGILSVPVHLIGKV